MPSGYEESVVDRARRVVSERSAFSRHSVEAAAHADPRRYELPTQYGPLREDSPSATRYAGVVRSCDLHSRVMEMAREDDVRALKERGYALALDDACRYSRKFEPLLEFVDDPSLLQHANEAWACSP